MKAGFYKTAWTANLETGIDAIDVQHRQYFQLLDHYLEASNTLSTAPEQAFALAEKFSFLLQYAKKHFSSEESIMAKTEYPAYKEHKEQHVYFSNRVEKLFERMRKEGFSPELAREVNYYTIEWFIEHIGAKDVKLAEFLKQKASTDSEIMDFLNQSVHISTGED